MTPAAFSAPIAPQPTAATQTITNSATATATYTAAPVVDTVTSAVSNTTETVADTNVGRNRAGRDRYRHERRAGDHHPHAPLI